jgi:hypothetical protein
MQRAAQGRQGQEQTWPARGVGARKVVLAAVFTVLLHVLALVAFIRGFELGPELDFAPRAPLQVSLIRPEATVEPVARQPRPPAPRPSLPAAAVRPSPPLAAARPPAPPGDAATAQQPVSGAQGITQPEPMASAAEPAPAEEDPPAVVPAAPLVADGPPGDPGVLARLDTPAPDKVDPGARAALYGVALGAPVPGRSRFQVYFGEYSNNHPVATMEYTIETDGERYRMTSEARAQGLTSLLYSGAITQRSRGRLGPDGLLPEHFVEQRSKRPERWSAVDYIGAQVSFSGGQRVPLQPGSQDRLSMLLQLGLILRALPQRLVAGQTITIPELGSRSIDAAIFASEGNEVLETPSGPLQTVHLVRRDGDPARDPKVDVWLGYDHHFKPVRIRLTDVGGRVLDQLLVP